MSETQPIKPVWNIGPAIAAWLVPGLGHYLLGQKKRGLILCVSISLAWSLGLLIGGITAIDRRDHTMWYFGQMLVAPTVVVDYVHQKIKARDPEGPLPFRNPAYVPSFSHVNEQGVLYVGVAGLLNLLAIIDVIYRDPRDLRYQTPAVDPIDMST